MSQMFKIFVGNINFTTTEEQLKDIFEPHITIEDLVIARDEETGVSRGYAFVMTRDPEEGRRAMKSIGKFELEGRLVYLKESHDGKKKNMKPAMSRGRGRGPRRDGPPRGGGRPRSGGGGYSRNSDGGRGGGYSNPNT